MSFWNILFPYDDEGTSNNEGYSGEGTSNNEGYPHVSYYAGAGYNEYDGYVGHNDGQNCGDNGGNKESTDDDDVPNLYQTTKVFASRDELVNWATNIARENGFVIVTGRSRSSKTTGEVIFVSLKCDRGGTYKGTVTQRKTGTKKGNCTFELHGKFNLNMGGWIVQVIDHKHDHAGSENLEGYPYAERLTDEEFQFVKQLTLQNMQPKDIFTAMKHKFPANVFSLKTIQNARAKIKKAFQIGEMPMQVFFSALGRSNYVYYYREDQATNAVDSVLFIHPQSYILWHAFPHVLMIDSTYKTNQYKMPFVQMVGVTSTKLSFCVAHAFMSSEREENYTWVLEGLKETLEDQCIEPRVIVTDRELGLMNACQQVFPYATQLLCMWHIFECIVKHCKPNYLFDKEWNEFEFLWTTLIKSSDEPTYATNYDNLFRHMISRHAGAWFYLRDNWLTDYKEKFVSVWIDRTLNYNQHTNNRVESHHSLLKSHLRSTNSTMDAFVPAINNILLRQEAAIKKSFIGSKIKRMNHHNVEVLADLRGKVSLGALDLLADELQRRERLIKSRWPCGCRLYRSCGLPYACQLDQYIQAGQKVPLNDIDPFWSKLDVSPTYIYANPKVDVQKELDLVAKHLRFSRSMSKNLDCLKLERL